MASGNPGATLRREWPQANVSLLQKQIAAIVHVPDVKRLLEFLGRLRRLRLKRDR
jgi:hypothetical protein